MIYFKDDASFNQFLTVINDCAVLLIDKSRTFKDYPPDELRKEFNGWITDFIEYEISTK